MRCSWQAVKAAYRPGMRAPSALLARQCLGPTAVVQQVLMPLQVVEAAHCAGIRTSSTIMFGHVDSFGAWARHLLALRALQARTGGITEFVPLPFVHMQAPIYLKGEADCATSL
jgi:hypothetical protein